MHRDPAPHVAHPVPPDEPHDPARALRDAVRQLVVAHGALQEMQRPCGATLTIPHAYALLTLLQQQQGGGPLLTITALAERLHIDRTNVSRLCQRLVHDGELDRVPHPHDGRAWVVSLTPLGTRLAQRIDALSAGYFAQVLQHLPADITPQLAALAQLCTALDTHRRAVEPASE